MVFASLTACAQEVETMIKRTVDEDEMKENPGGTVWVCKHMAMMVSGEDAVITMFCKEHVFDDEPFKFGFYDESGKLVLFIKSWHAKPSSDRQNATFVANGFSNDSIAGARLVNGSLGKYMIPTKAVVDYVTTHKGKIRVLTTAYGGHEYEVLAVIKEE